MRKNRLKVLNITVILLIVMLSSEITYHPASPSLNASMGGGFPNQISGYATLTQGANSAPFPSYTLTVSTSPLSAGTTDPSPGSYTYSAGSSVTVRAIPNSGWKFSGWFVNGKYAGNATLLAVTVDAETAVQASFSLGQQQTSVQSVTFATSAHLNSLTVDGRNYPLPASFNWPLGSTHHVFAPASITDDGQNRTVFSGWSGSINSRSSSLELVVSGNMGVIASYNTQYLVQLQFTDRSGRVIVPQDVTLVGPRGITQLHSNNSVWLDGGARYQIGSAIWEGVNVASFEPAGTTVTATRPGVIAISMPVYNAAFKVTDITGLPIQGALVNLTVGGVKNLAKYTNGNGTTVFTQIPLGTFSGAVSFLGVSTPVSSTLAGDHSYTITTVLSYPFLSLVAAFAIITGVFVARSRGRKRV